MKRPLPDISDQKLVVLLKRDDLKSYEALFHRYYDLFLTFTKRVVREHAAAEDIVQEVFMQLWLGRDRLDEHRSLYNLLFTMTKHRIYDHFRRRYNLEALRRPLSEFDAVSDEAESPESYVAQNGSFPVIDSGKNAAGDTVITTGDGKGTLVRYTFTE